MTKSQRAFWKQRIKNAPHFRVFYDLVLELETTDAPFSVVAEAAKVSAQTLHNWVEGRVYYPHLRTVASVAHAMGYDIILSAPKVSHKKAA